MKYVFFMLLAMLFVSACSQEIEEEIPENVEGVNEQETGQSGIPPTNEEVTLAKVECEDKGGQLIGCFTVTGYACSMPTADAGKPCSNSSECEEECVAPPGCPTGESAQGTCAARSHLVCSGVQSVENGRCSAVMIT